MQETSYGPCLVVADRGHVWVGHLTRKADGHHVQGARAVRRWGTTAGLNELVSGPKEATKLDAAADLIIADRAVIAIIPVEAAAWAKHLGQ